MDTLTNSPAPAKKAVVLGATGSLGATLTRRLLSAGWVVFGVSARSAGSSHSPGFKHVQIDLSAPVAPDELFALFESVAPNLVLHAAVSYGDVKNPPLEMVQLEMMFRINAFAFYLAFQRYCTRPTLDPFCSCVVVNSDSIYHATGKIGAYASSKAALRVLTAALAETCRSANASVSTLLLGPLADAAKITQLRSLADKHGVSEVALTREYLRKSNPFLVVSELIELDSCYEMIDGMVRLGKEANGMLCKLDGGSSGSLI